MKNLFGTVLIFCVLPFLISFDYAAPEIKPKREASIIVNQDGFYPQRIISFVGEEIKIYLTSTTQEPSCFMLRDQNVFISAKKGEITETTVQFEKPGQYTFHCPVGSISGTIMVLPNKKLAKAQDATRSVASAKPKVWRPN